MNRDEDRIIAEAAAWHAASSHDGMDWNGFTAWLEADPRHRSAYDEVALADSFLDEHHDALRPANDEPFAEEPAPRRAMIVRWKRWTGIAIAASLVLVLAVPQFLQPAPLQYRTSGAPRSIALADGSTVILAPHSSLSVEGRKQEHMALNGGAWFEIRHDPARQLSISAGDVEISDIGTQFDVQANGDQVRVEVADGEVNVSSRVLSQPIHLTRGRGLLFDGKGGAALVMPVSDNDIGEWRSGRLTYDSTPLPLVVADLSRYAGVRVNLSDALRDRRFSGTLVVGDGQAAIRDLSQVMDLELRRDSGGYRLYGRQR